MWRLMSDVSGLGKRSCKSTIGFEVVAPKLRQLPPFLVIISPIPSDKQWKSSHGKRSNARVRKDGQKAK